MAFRRVIESFWRDFWASIFFRCAVDITILYIIHSQIFIGLYSLIGDKVRLCIDAIIRIKLISLIKDISFAFHNKWSKWLSSEQRKFIMYLKFTTYSLLFSPFHNLICVSFHVRKTNYSWTSNNRLILSTVEVRTCADPDDARNRQ